MEMMFVVMVQYEDDPRNVTPEMIFRYKWKADDYSEVRKNQLREDGYNIVSDIDPDEVIDDLNNVYVWVEEVEVR